MIFVGSLSLSMGVYGKAWTAWPSAFFTSLQRGFWVWVWLGAVCSCLFAVLDCPIDERGLQPGALPSDPRDGQLLAQSGEALRAAALQREVALRERFALLHARGVRLLLCTYPVGAPSRRADA